MKRDLDTLKEEEEQIGCQLFGQTPITLDIVKCIAIWCVEECIFTFGSFCLVSKGFNEAARNPVAPYVYFSYSPHVVVLGEQEQVELPLSLPGITRSFHPFPTVLSPSIHSSKKTKRTTTTTTTKERSKDFKDKETLCNHRNSVHPSFYEEVTGCWQVACKFVTSANVCSAYNRGKLDREKFTLRGLYCSPACQCVHEVPRLASLYQ